jgi:tRNA threonylcarbamoyladenosine biosynthesis protein TsaE
MQYISHNEEDTQRLGTALGNALEAGTVIAMIGELGAGKTRLVQATAVAMGVERNLVNSPTFVLIQEYEGRLPLYHFDTYRLRDEDEFLELGADELMGTEGVCLIEWADRVAGVLPDDHLKIEIAITGPSERVFKITATGPKSERLLSGLEETLSL